MDLSLLRFIAQAGGASLTATARPATTFFAVQALVGTLIWWEVVSLPAELAWVVAWPAILLGGVVALTENLAAHDPDIAEVVHDLGADRVAGAVGTLSVAVLFAAMGLPADEAAQLANPEVLAGLSAASGWAAAAGQASWAKWGVVALAVSANLGLGWMRARVMSLVVDLNLASLWSRVETGGVVGVLLLVLLLPLVAVVVLLALGVGLSIAGISASGLARWWDARRREPCEGCGHGLRVEACRCPECGASRTPSLVLGEASPVGSG